jgi:hypothetical protein
VQRSSDRYDPLPSLAALPAWIWRRLPTPARVALGWLPVVALGLVLLLGPGIDRSKDERARAESERLERLRAERARQIRAEQRPRFGRAQAAGASLARRAALVDALAAAVTADARARVRDGSLDGPILRVACEGYPRTVDRSAAHLEPDRPVGLYACLAIRREVAPGERNEAAAIGHPYRARIDFETGRYAFCKVTGRAGEGSIGAQPLVVVPRACGRV